ncbi:MAG: hypothetical protein OES32_09975 [Acidobacteriota bacterium]|nr:hypothetical protein [Acidobacteriota bacterium]MDH3523900.1 hypothetical protein [Acidobacteriota bacterium]
MKLTKSMIPFLGLTALIALACGANGPKPPERGFFVEDQETQSRAPANMVLTCKGEVGLVLDAANEGVRTTTDVFGTGPGGGEGGEFDPAPVLSIPEVFLDEGECLDAHLSVIVGSAQTYGVAPLALFQVTLTPVGGGPRHMVGHYETPYGIPSPAVALEAETDVDMLAANFFQRVGSEEHDVPPGVYRVDVWWAGAPPGVPGGAIGAAFVLKLYLRD